MCSDDVVAAIERNLVATWSAFDCLPEAEVYDGPDMMRLVTGQPFAVSNGIFRAAFDSASVDDSIAEVTEHFRRLGLPFSWMVGPGSRPADLGSRLEAHGFLAVGDWPGMAIDLESDAGPPKLAPGITVEEVTSVEALAVWSRVFSHGFEMPAGVGDFFRRAFTCMGLGDDRALRHFLAQVEGEPAACSSVSLAAGVAGIYNVATVPQARGRGLGSVISTWPLHAARAAGFRVAVLHATDMAVNVYRRLGFREHCRIGQYVWEPPQ